MKKTLGFLAGLMLVLSIVPAAFANTPTDGEGLGINVGAEGFVPLIWMDPDSRIFYRNPADGGLEMIERIANYAFEGEQIAWQVLVMDKNGVEDIDDVYVTIGSVQGTGNDIEANCDLAPLWFDGTTIEDDDDITQFNAMIDQEQLLIFDSDVMAVYNCVLTVETSFSMYGEYWVVAEVTDGTDQNTFDENEYWFFNPIITLFIDGSIDFDTVTPGTLAYSSTVLVGNGATDGSGILLDMTISGSDFYDPASSGAKCPLSNRIRLNSGGTGHDYQIDGIADPAQDFDRSAQTDCDSPFMDESNDCPQSGGCTPTVDDLDGPDLDADIDSLSGEDEFDAFCYYATNGAYSTNNDVTRRDGEGYLGIPYETGDEHDRAPIISSTDTADQIDLGGGAKSYFAGNVLTPGAEIAVTFRLALPEPCSGDFSDGQISFWGTAI